MLAQRSEALGIVNEYSSELLESRGALAELQGRMMSYDEFYQMACMCPEDMGMSQSFTSNIFGAGNELTNQDHAWHPGHDDHDKPDHDHDKEKKADKKKKKRTRRLGWFAFSRS